MRKTAIGFLGLLAAGLLSAAPDCNWSGRWSNRTTDQADGVTTFKTNSTTPVPAPGQRNTSTGCTAWIMIVDVEGFSADSIELDVAPSSPGGVAGTYSASTGLTTVSGSNPTTTTTISTYLATGYSPWYRANVTTVTGTGSINVQIFGYRSQTYLTAGGSGIGVGLTPASGGQESSSTNGVFFHTPGTASTRFGTGGTYTCWSSQPCSNYTGVVTIVTGASGISANVILDIIPSVTTPNGSYCNFIAGDSTTATYMAAHVSYPNSASAWTPGAQLAGGTTYNLFYYCFAF